MTEREAHALIETKRTLPDEIVGARGRGRQGAGWAERDLVELEEPLGASLNSRQAPVRIGFHYMTKAKSMLKMLLLL